MDARNRGVPAPPAKALARGNRLRQHARTVSARILILANPIAGGGRSRRLAPELATILQSLGCHAEVYFTKAAGDAAARARVAGPEPWDALVAVGGDGTLNEVLNGMPDPTRPLGVLPVGTANVLASEYRIPRSPRALAPVIASLRTTPHAIGLAGSRRFLLFCGAGLDAAIVEHLHHRRSGTLGKTKWLPSIGAIVHQWPQHTLRATLADGEVLDDLSSVLVTRVRNYGGVARLPRHIDPASDQLYVLCFRSRSRIAWAAMGLCAALGVLRSGRNLVMRTTREVLVLGNAPTQVDGDLGSRSPLRIGLHDVTARLLVP
jgi:diacylglycerol kinase family enzyme